MSFFLRRSCIHDAYYIRLYEFIEVVRKVFKLSLLRRDILPCCITNNCCTSATKISITGDIVLNELCKNQMTIADLVDWLLGGDIHFILTHVHQGFQSHGIFVDMDQMMQELLRLRFHIGFPSGDSLYCPVFTQDKIRYLRALGDMANNTLRIPMNMEQNCFSNCLDSIVRFFLQLLN